MIITQCRSCNSKNLKSIISLGEQYLSEFNLPNQPKPEKYPLDLIMCGDCSLLQLKESVPASKLYTENYGYKSGINNTIRADLTDIAQKAQEKVKLESGDTVLDIGCNDGELLSNYSSDYCRVGFDPIKKFAEEAKKKCDVVINNFWSYEAWAKTELEGIKVKIITVISCFYDLENPNKFLDDCLKVLAEDGIIVIQQNYLGNMLPNHAFDNIVHEHLEYYSLKSLEHLLTRHNLEVFDVELNDINGGSFRVFVKRMPLLKQMRLYEEKLKIDNWGTYFLFSLHIKEIKNKVRNFIIQEANKGKKIYLYGASTRGNSLIQYFELNNNLIKAAVERNPEKWGKVIASLDIPIISEEQARKEKPDFMLVLPWFFKKEFVEREKDYLKNGGHLIFSLPEFEVV